MKYKLRRFGKAFRVVFCVREAQASEMLIAPDKREGCLDNRHHGARRWLSVVAGSGLATIGTRRQ